MSRIPEPPLATFADVDRATDDDDDDDESRRREQIHRELSAPPAWAAVATTPLSNFAPVVGECTLNDLVVDGVLPPGLDGGTSTTRTRRTSVARR